MTILDMLKRKSNSMTHIEGSKILPKITLKKNEDQPSTVVGNSLPPLAPTPTTTTKKKP